MNNNENINYPIPKITYTVLARCATYNQSKYICKTLNGFAMQRTNFPFVCLVMDDASTDGEQEVIKEWMECECDMNKAEIIDIPTSIVIIVPHKTNFSCTFAFYLLKQNLYGTGKKIYFLNPWREKCKYEALCEGDDYWIDPLKLQKQVDFLDKNTDYGLVRTNINQYIQKDHQIIENFFSKGNWSKIKDTYHDYIIHGWYAAPCTWLYRTEYIEKYKKLQHRLQKENCFIGDILLLLCIAENSKIKYYPESTAMYRVLEKSASHFNSFDKSWNFFIKNKNTRTFFAKDESWNFKLKYLCLVSYYHLIFILQHKKINFLFKWVIEVCRDLKKLFHL